MNANANHPDSHSSHQHHAEIGWQWPIICGSGLLVILLGTVGFIRLPAENANPIGFLDALYDSLKLFHMHFDRGDRPLPWELQVARFLAPLVVLSVLFKAFVTVVRGHRRILLHRTKQGHVVICGLGRKGLQLAMNFHQQGRWVVVIEKDANNEFLHECEDEGILYWIGDAGHQSLLQKARGHCAELLIAITGDDGKNVEVAMRAAELCRQRSGEDKSPLRCFMHIVDPQLRKLFREHPVFSGKSDRFEVTMFDFYENCALALFQEHALDGESGIRPGANTSARLVIVGFGQMGESVLLQAARIGHFAGSKKLRAIIIDPQSARLKQNFYRRYPNVDKTCEAQFFNFEFDSAEIVEKVAQWRAEQSTVLTFAVCCDDDTRSMTMALALKSQLKERPATILVRMSSTSGLTSLLSNAAGGGGENQPLAGEHWLDHIHPFGMLEALCTPDGVLQPDLDRMAERIHEDYVRNMEEQSSKENKLLPTGGAVMPWKELEADYRNANRQQALHLQIKLRAIGCAIVSPVKENVGDKIFQPDPQNGEAITEFTNANEIELLAQMEHERWCAERWLAGWEFAPIRNNAARKHNALVEWSRLSPDDQAKDRAAVKLIPKLFSVIRKGTAQKT